MKKITLLLFCMAIFSSCEKEDFTSEVKSESTAKKLTTTDLSAYPTKRQNTYPIVLVHGMCGWGRDEMLGYKYWGGLGDTQTYLTLNGYKTFTASVGPLSSNWDRAVELYYNIVGGRVDYGAAHALKHGHNRYGETYTGFYKQWSATNKVHFVGHSLGGASPRVLIQLLENGDAAEMAYVPAKGEAPTSDLFKGNKKNWVASHTSIAGVQNGALTVDSDSFREQLMKMILGMGAVGGIGLEQNTFYNFDLGQWGLQRQPKETVKAYFDRILAKKASGAPTSARFWDSKDNCMYDMKVSTMQQQNELIKSSPNVYYASYTFNDTKEQSNGNWTPLPSMSLLFQLESANIGKTSANLPEGFQSWRPNDGLVSVVASQYPLGHDYVLMDPANRKLAPRGAWDVHPTINGQDHLSVVAPDLIQSTNIWLNKFYLGIAKDLSCLPK
jgi:triacylglycerol lipase